jgi:hypothetical protein
MDNSNEIEITALGVAAISKSLILIREHLPEQEKALEISQGFSLSVFVFLITVFCHRLSIMAILTQRLPVGLIPEQFFISTMRNHMVHNGGFHQLPTFPAPDTQRVFFQVPSPGFPPASVITPLRCSGTLCLIQIAVFFTIG